MGLAVKPEKWAKHVGQALQAKALAAGFRLKLLDPDRPLEEQGPLDAVLQKLRRPGGNALPRQPLGAALILLGSAAAVLSRKLILSARRW